MLYGNPFKSTAWKTVGFVLSNNAQGRLQSVLASPAGKVKIQTYGGVSGGSDSKESAGNMTELGLISGSGKSPGEKNGYTLQYFCLDNSIAKAAAICLNSPMQSPGYLNKV